MTNKDIKLKGLFLDDERFPQDVTWIQYPDNIEWTIVRNFQDFNLELAHGDNDYQIYSFDHDIQSYIDGREYTGYDCLKCLLSVEAMINNKLDNMRITRANIRRNDLRNYSILLT